MFHLTIRFFLLLYHFSLFVFLSLKSVYLDAQVADNSSRGMFESGDARGDIGEQSVTLGVEINQSPSCRPRFHFHLKGGLSQCGNIGMVVAQLLVSPPYLKKG
jgi:hypothetical protein